MPDIYAEGDFDLAGFAVGVVPLHRAIDPMRVEPDDTVIGLASSGVHSNGFTLVNRIIRDGALETDRVYPALGRDAAETLQGQAHRVGHGPHHRRRAARQCRARAAGRGGREDRR
jgi:phosphoribosylaminoimidazole (AIR) synthetase